MGFASRRENSRVPISKLCYPSVVAAYGNAIEFLLRRRLCEPLSTAAMGLPPCLFARAR